MLVLGHSALLEDPESSSAVGGRELVCAPHCADRQVKLPKQHWISREHPVCAKVCIFCINPTDNVDSEQTFWRDNKCVILLMR